ncbi:MAG: JAB domain-containing protein [Burkholderiales bacterium]
MSERPLINNPEKVSQLLLARSYPSGTAKPSQADQLLTTQLRRTLAGLEIAILDYLIVAGSRAISAGGV